MNRTLLSYLIELLIFAGIIFMGISYYNRQLNTSEQNIIALKGNIEQLELKNGELLVSRDSYIATINELDELLNISKQEIRDIQNQLNSKLAYIAKIEQTTKINYVEVVKDSIVYITKNSAVAKFHYSDKWLSLSGENKFNFTPSFNYTTTIDNIELNTNLTVGLTDDYKIFVTSDNPYINFSNIDGAVIDNSVLRPKKKRFNWGFQFGFGVSYDIIKQDYSIGPYTGIGAEINF
jgi:hypothetical protein